MRASIASNRPESEMPTSKKKPILRSFCRRNPFRRTANTARALPVHRPQTIIIVPSCKTLCEEEKNSTTCSAHTHTHADSVARGVRERATLKDRTEQEHIAPSHGVGPIVCVLCVYLHVCPFFVAVCTFFAELNVYVPRICLIDMAHIHIQTHTHGHGEKRRTAHLRRAQSHPILYTINMIFRQWNQNGAIQYNEWPSTKKPTHPKETEHGRTRLAWT